MSPHDSHQIDPPLCMTMKCSLKKMCLTSYCNENTHINSELAYPRLEARPHDVISCTQPLSNSLIRKLSLWFQHNSTKKSYDTNRIVCTGLNKLYVMDISYLSNGLTFIQTESIVPKAGRLLGRN